MITREEHLQWCKEHIDPLTEAEEETGDAASVRFKELTLNMLVAIVAHDWRETGDHMREVCRQVKGMSATNMHYFQAYHDFPNGQLDSIVTVVSVDEFTEEFAEVLADLFVNLGAEGS